MKERSPKNKELFIWIALILRVSALHSLLLIFGCPRVDAPTAVSRIFNNLFGKVPLLKLKKSELNFD